MEANWTKAIRNTDKKEKMVLDWSHTPSTIRNNRKRCLRLESSRQEEEGSTGEDLETHGGGSPRTEEKTAGSEGPGKEHRRRRSFVKALCSI
jgi:hypothetical protein